MEAYTWKKVNMPQLTFLWLLSGVCAQLNMPQSSMQVTQGQMVVLVAWYSPQADTDISANTVVWNFVSNITDTIISYTKGTTSVSNTQFQGRVSFSAAMPSANVTLFINNSQEADSGRYLCQVLMPGSSIIQQLTLDVLVPPGVPQCAVVGRPLLKSNVTLSCSSSGGKPSPIYRWRKTSPTSEVFFSPLLNEKTGTLLLSNLSSNMSGKYMCMASNTAGSQSCYVNLEVITPTSAGVIAGATVGALIGFIILFIFIFFLVKRWRNAEDDMANEIKEDAQAPKRVSWARGGGGLDTVSRNGTMSSMGSSPHHHGSQQHLQRYPQRPPSDTVSVLTATGSTTVGGYRPPPPRHPHGASHYGYDASATNGSGGGSLTRTERPGPLPQAQPTPQSYIQLPQAQPAPQAYSQLQFGPPSPGQQQQQQRPHNPPLITASNIARMGGVPIMVPAQSQAGSLV